MISTTTLQQIGAQALAGARRYENSLCFYPREPLHIAARQAAKGAVETLRNQRRLGIRSRFGFWADANYAEGWIRQALALHREQLRSAA